MLGIDEAVLVYVIDLACEPSAAESEVFQRQAASLEAAGVKVHVETPLGYPPHAIASLALEWGADIIVMGTRGQGLFHTGFSGSVSSDVVRLSPVPVLLTPGSMVTDAQSGGAVCSRLLESVLVPVDLSSGTERTCDLACGLARAGIGRLEFLNVVEMTFEALREEREPRAHEQLAVLADIARARGITTVVTTVARGVPDRVVSEYAASGRYTLIALAPRCHDTIDQEFGSVASAVIRESSTPVLLAPPECATPAYGRGNT